MAHSGPKPPHPDTLAVHAGQSPDPATGARAVPIYQTASFVFPDADTAAALFNMETPGHVYSRLSNPTVSVFEERMAALEDGVGAIATASGQAALHLAIATLMGEGGHVVASASLYGGSHNLLSYTLPRFGIATTFVPAGDPDAWRRAIRPETRLLFGESVGNPSVDVLDIPALAKIAEECHVPLLVDATVTTPALGRPFEMGAHLVMHSATKFLSGHGIVIGGVLVDGGRFDWAADPRFPTLTEPYEGFHGMVFAEESPTSAFLLRARREGLRDFGACMAPVTAFHILQGLETLPLRMARHIENTARIVRFLAAHEAVERVHHPDVESHPQHALARRQMRDPAGRFAPGILVYFVLKGSPAQARRRGARMMDWLASHSLAITLAVSLGQVRTLIEHPASMTHAAIPPADQARGGIDPGGVRLSLGIEDPADLIHDLEEALAKV